MAHLPTGTVTFLFTDIEGSTRLWERHPEAMKPAIARHDEILRAAIELQGGYVFKTVGDAFCAAFTAATDALGAALEAQRALHAEDWGKTGPLRVRMALHTGAADERGDDYFGPSVNRVARLLSAGHGGQVLLSLTTKELVRDQMPTGAALRDLGERRLKDLFRPERVFQLTSPDLPSSFPPLKTLDARLNNLPAQPTPLIGREREVRDICALLREKDVRLLTLTGPGGTGKTRLGLQVTAELLDEFEDGVFFAPLASITDANLVIPTVLRTLDIRETGERSPEEGLKDYLQNKEMLLLLDNFEQVIEAAPPVGELLATCPTLKVLATSRSTLGVYGEREFPVPPLELPDPEQLPTVEHLTQYEAVRLFIDRAKAARPDFSVTNENAPAVAEICARLDGLPLAIELAATRIKLLPPQAMLDHLDNRLKLLRGGARNLPARQQTLRGAIEWSHALLGDSEKTLFARLAVFSGGFTLEAIEAICDAEDDLPVDALEGVSSLLNKSLIRQEEGPGGEPRFAMLETIREFAREKLQESGEAEIMKRAHAEYFLALAEEAEPELKKARQAAWLEQLEAEHGNLRAALSWAFASNEPELALRFAGAMATFWYRRGDVREGRRWLEAALATEGDTPSMAARAKVLAWAGWLARIQGDYERSEAFGEEALALYRQLGDEANIQDALLNVGMTALFRRNFEWATAALEEVAALQRASGDEVGLGRTLHGLVFVADGRRDYERAIALHEEGLKLGRKTHDDYGVLFSLFSGASACLGLGDHQRARELLTEGLGLSQRLKMERLTAYQLHVAAALAASQGQPIRAIRVWGAAEALRETVGAALSPLQRHSYEPYIDAARAQLEEGACEIALQEGRTITLEQAIEYALSTEEELPVPTYPKLTSR